MKQITVYYNQYSQSGAVERESWELESADRIHRGVGAVETLREKIIEIPDGWSVGADFAGTLQLYGADGYQVKLTGGAGTIKYIDGATAAAVRFKEVTEA